MAHRNALGFLRSSNATDPLEFLRREREEDTLFAPPAAAQGSTAIRPDEIIRTRERQEELEAAPPLEDVLQGRSIEAITAAGKGLLALPAGFERLGRAAAEPILDLIGLGEDDRPTVEMFGIQSDRPLESMVEMLDEAQRRALEAEGIEPSTLNQIAFEIVGSLPGFKGVSKIGAGAVKLLGRTFGPGVFRVLGTETSIAALSKSERIGRHLRTVGARTVEGGAFIAGVDPESSAGEIIIGAGTGTIAGSIETAWRLRRARKLARVSPDEALRAVTVGDDAVSRELAELEGQIDNNVELTRWFADRADDEIVASAEAAIAESGGSGTMNVVRGLTDLDDATLNRLRETYPNFRFERVSGEHADDILFGIKPDATLPEGVKTAAKLTDKAIESYEKAGLLRGQTVLVDGVEHSFLSVTRKGDFVVQPIDGGRRFFVDPGRVQGLNAAKAGLQAPQLAEEFRAFRSANAKMGFTEAFDEFVSGLDDFDNTLRPALRNYLASKERAFFAEQLPEEAKLVERFKTTLRKLSERQGDEALPLDEFAAARGQVLQHLGDGRIKVVDLQNGRTVLRPNPESTRAYLEGLRKELADITPDVPFIPEELLAGAARAAPPPNPAIPTEQELVDVASRRLLSEGSLDAVKKFWLAGPGRWATGIEPLAQKLEKLTGARIWSDAIQPLSRDLTVAMNESEQFITRLFKLRKRIKDDRIPVIEEWLRSELKPQVARTHNMSDREIAVAQEIRRWADDLFEKLTELSGTDLSTENYFRNWVPDAQTYVAETGRVDFEQALFGGRQNVPEDFKFFSEMFKSGELSLRPQDDLFTKLSRTTRAGLQKGHAGESYKRALGVLAETNDDDAAKVLTEYLTGVRGMPDATRQEMNRIVGEFHKGLGLRATVEQRQTLIDGMISMTYGGLMGFRPGLIARNLTQPYQLFAPLIPGGFRRTLAAQLRTAPGKVDDDLLEWMLQNGVVRRQPPFTEAEAIPTIEELASSEAKRRIFSRMKGWIKNLNSKSIKAYSTSDQWNRATVGSAMKNLLEKEVPKRLNGELTQTELLRRTGMSALEKPVQNGFLDLVEAGSIEEAVAFGAREMANFSQFIYGKTNAMAWTRSVPGRIAGSYSTWPVGYFNWLRTALNPANTAPDIPIRQAGEVVSRAMKHGLVNTALYSATIGTGINLGAWVAWNSLGYSGGPYLSVAADMFTLMRGFTAEVETDLAKRRLARTLPRLVFPGATLVLRDIPEATAALQNGDTHEALLHLAGIPLVRDGGSNIPPLEP